MLALLLSSAWWLTAFTVCGKRYRPDEIIRHPKDVTAREGDVAEFSCIANRSPDVTDSPLLIVWKLNNSFLFSQDPAVNTFLTHSSDGSQTTARLRIAPTNRDRDAGTYRCSAASFNEKDMVDSRPARLTFVRDLPGAFVEDPSDVNVMLGATATLRCRPPVSLATLPVRWEKDGRELVRNNRIRMVDRSGLHRLRIKKVVASDAAVYVCVVSSSSSKSATVSIRRESAPTPTASVCRPVVHPSRAFVRKGESASFKCTSKCSSRVEWFKGKENLHSTARISVSQSSGLLEFRKVGKGQVGNYTCKDVGTSTSVTVQLETTRIGSMRGGGLKTATAGESIDLSCLVPKWYPRPTVKWYYEGRELLTSDKYWQHHEGMFINECDEEDSGLYQCVATNEAGSRNITWELTVMMEVDTIPIPTDYTASPPSLTDIFRYKPFDVTASLFDSIRWDCQIVLNPDIVTYVWQHGDQTYSNDISNRIQAYRNGSLVINAVRREDRGVWTCRADFGEGTSEMITASVSILEPTGGAVPLRFDHGGKSPSLLYIGQRQSQSLLCTVWSMYPPVVITWLKDGLVIKRVVSVTESASNTLTIVNFEKSDSGFYVCDVRDGRNMTVRSETIVTVVDPPVVSIMSEIVTANQQEDLKLTCKVTSGEDGVTWSWRAAGWPGLPQSAARRFVDHGNGTLVIKNAKTFDTNTYWCIASNAGGDAAMSVNVTVNKVGSENGVSDGGFDLVPVVPVVAVCGVVYIALMVALGVWCYWRCRHKADTKAVLSHSRDTATAVNDNGFLNEFEIVRSHLERGSNSFVGSGQYWTVYKAELKKRKYKGDDSVAVSVLVKECDEKAFSREKFMTDVTAVKSLQHASVASLIGVCTNKQPYLMVTENLDQGDLKKYLTEIRMSEGLLTMSDQSSLLRQSATGLQYLCSRAHIHKDIAARNCLVSRHLLIKISDLSLCVDGYKDDYVLETPAVSGQYRPLRWMSPEAILRDEFTKENDVWSFGIFMWEVVTLARQPYEGLSNSEVITAIKNGHLLEQSGSCPDDLYEIMQSCWLEDPVDRPTFELICGLL